MYSSNPNLVRDLCAGIARVQRQREDIEAVVRTLFGLVTVEDIEAMVRTLFGLVTLEEAGPHTSHESLDLWSRELDTGQWCIKVVRQSKSNGQNYLISSVGFRRNGVWVYRHEQQNGISPSLPMVGIVHYQLKYLVLHATQLFPALEDRLLPFLK